MLHFAAAATLPVVDLGGIIAYRAPPCFWEGRDLCGVWALKWRI